MILLPTADFHLDSLIRNLKDFGDHPTFPGVLLYLKQLLDFLESKVTPPTGSLCLIKLMVFRCTLYFRRISKY